MDDVLPHSYPTERNAKPDSYAGIEQPSSPIAAVVDDYETLIFPSIFLLVWILLSTLSMVPDFHEYHTTDWLAGATCVVHRAVTTGSCHEGIAVNPTDDSFLPPTHPPIHPSTHPSTHPPIHPSSDSKSHVLQSKYASRGTKCHFFAWPALASTRGAQSVSPGSAPATCICVYLHSALWIGRFSGGRSSSSFMVPAGHVLLQC